MKKIISATVLLLVFTLATAHAHSVWINSFESHAHQPHHTMVSVGWGHAMPLGDILTSPNGRVAIDSFALIAPDMKKTPLHTPAFKLSEPFFSDSNADLYDADLAVQKVGFKKESLEGVYQLSLASKPNFYTKYIDKKGKQRLKLKPKNEIKDIQKILMSIKYQAFAKSLVTLGQWKNPAPLGHGLEIIPLTDMSNLHTGDLVEVKVLFYGTPLNASAQSLDFITAQSRSFGQDEGFSLHSYIVDGKAKFRVQAPGQWKILVNHKKDVTEDGELKDLYGKVDQVFHGASLTFQVH